MKRDLSDNDLDYYISFLRRYHSRLTEAFDVVARSCVVDGFQKGVQSDEIDSQGQVFFGSLGVVELTFSVIQVSITIYFLSHFCFVVILLKLLL